MSIYARHVAEKTVRTSTFQLPKKRLIDSSSTEAVSVIELSLHTQSGNYLVKTDDGLPTIQNVKISSKEEAACKLVLLDSDLEMLKSILIGVKNYYQAIAK